MEKFGNRVLTLLGWMDKRSYVRMIVCIVPGIIICKIVAQLELPQPAGLIATLFMFAGMIVHFQWARLRDRILDTQEYENPGNAREAVNEERTTAEMLQELVALFHGDEAKANEAVMLELQLDDSLTGADALAIALNRKAAVTRLTAAPRSDMAITSRSGSLPQPTTTTHPGTP